MDNAAHIDAKEFARITNVSRETFHAYQTWYNLLTHWNKKINLVSPSTINNYWLRHALDSWQVFAGFDALAGLAPVLNDEIPHQVRDDKMGMRDDSARVAETTSPFNILDLGSGAGFPGLAAAIHFRTLPNAPTSNAHVYLVEANGKKCNFLRAVIRELGLPATAVQARAENVPSALKNKHFNIITARAFAPLPKLLEYTAPYWSVDTLGETLGIFPKGARWQEEVEIAQKHWDFNLTTTPSQTDQEARILLVKALKKREAL